MFPLREPPAAPAKEIPGTEPRTKNVGSTCNRFRVCRVFFVWRIQFPPSDALRLNRDGPPLSRLFFVQPSAA